MTKQETKEFHLRVAGALETPRLQRWLRVWSGAPSDDFADGPCAFLASALLILDGQRGKIVEFRGGNHYAYRPKHSHYLIDGHGCSLSKTLIQKWGNISDVSDLPPFLDNSVWSLTRALFEIMLLQRQDSLNE